MPQYLRQLSAFELDRCVVNATQSFPVMLRGLVNKNMLTIFRKYF